MVQREMIKFVAMDNIFNVEVRILLKDSQAFSLW